MIRFKFKKNLLQPHWRFSQSGNLWRIHIAGSKTLIGETRDLQLKKVYFLSVNIENGKDYFKNHLFEDGNYWVSIEGYNSKIFFLHRFENPNLPDHKSIIAIDNFSGNFLWENPDLIYFFNTENELYGYEQKFESFDYFLIDSATGNIIKQIPENEFDKLFILKEDISQNKYSDINYTQIADSDTRKELWGIVNNEILNNKIQGNIEFIEKGNYLCFNYLSAKENYDNKTESKFENIFCIYEIKERKRIYRDIIDKNANYSVPDCFFMCKDYLLYLKEKKEVVALILN